MRVITTKYHGPTNSRGSRMSATLPSGKRIYIEYDDALHVGEDQHLRAAIAMCQKMEWQGLICGGEQSSGVWVWTFAKTDVWHTNYVAAWERIK